MSTFELVRDIVTFSFIGLFLVDLIFRPRIDTTVEGDVLLWYKPLRKPERTYVKLYRKGR